MPFPWAPIIMGASMLGSAAMSGGGGGGEDDELNIKIPDFWQDPYYQKTQDQLYGLSSGMLEGKLPDFYSSLGQRGGKDFEDILSLISRDTGKAINENLVRRNISRGGLGASILAPAMADVGTKLRWEDFIRAQGEKENLLNLGVNTMGNVGSQALSMGSQRNAYELNKARLLMGQQAGNAELGQAAGQGWSNILSSGIGTVGKLLGMSGLFGDSTTSSMASGLNSGGALDILKLGF